MMNLNETVNMLDDELLLEEVGVHIKGFIVFCKEKLGIDDEDNSFNLNLHKDRNGMKTLANYNPNTGDVNVYIKNRLTADVLRSVAHELVHHKQRLDGKELDGTTGSPIEDEANAKAGALMREFGEQNPDIYEE